MSFIDRNESHADLIVVLVVALAAAARLNRHLDTPSVPWDASAAGKQNLLRALATFYLQL